MRKLIFLLLTTLVLITGYFLINFPNATQTYAQSCPTDTACVGYGYGGFAKCESGYTVHYPVVRCGFSYHSIALCCSPNPNPIPVFKFCFRGHCMW